MQDPTGFATGKFSPDHRWLYANELQNPISGKQTYTAQRWNLVRRLVWELLKGYGRSTLKVYIMKSEQPNYTTYTLGKTLDLLFDNVEQMYDWVYWDPTGYGIAQKVVDDSVKMTPTQIENSLCKMVYGKSFVSSNSTAKGALTRMHSKMVLVISPSTTRAAVSVGSLNMYNALMMHDYGNIVFDNFSDPSLTRTLYQRFQADWKTSVFPSNWDQNHVDRCGWNRNPQLVPDP
jgi:hypothetical protein